VPIHAVPILIGVNRIYGLETSGRCLWMTERLSL
jgi:hypothetical protein